MQEIPVPSLCWEDPLEEVRATHSSILAWRIPRKRPLVGYSPFSCRESDTYEETKQQQQQQQQGFAAAAAKSLHSCPTLCDPIDGSPPGSPIPGILLARTLEWVAISFSNASK